ncbi:MAG: hypothetical protein ABWY77_07975 [Acidimicrobiia bacterium]
MPVEEEVTALKVKLVNDYGEAGAAILMDRPPGGWSDLVTNESLHRELAAVESRFDLKLEALESRIEARFAGVDARFSSVDARFDSLEARMDARFSEVDHRFDRFEHQLLAQVDRRLRQQNWVMMSTVIAAMGIIVTALKV